MTDEIVIRKAKAEDLPEILRLQYLAYQSEAELFGSRDIPPLKQTLGELETEYREGTILKIQEKGAIIASVRAKAAGERVLIGKLMVHPAYRRRGLGRKLLQEIEHCFPGKNYELFTSTKSVNNIRFYESMGYREYARKEIGGDLVFVYLEKAEGGAKPVHGGGERDDL